MPLKGNLSSPRIAAVVLAAGASRRMGQAKMVLPIGDLPLIVHAVRPCVCLNFISTIVVVTGHQPDIVESALRQFNLRFVHNRDSDAGGMLSSVKLGLRAVAEETDAILIVLGDHPLVSPNTYEALRAAWCDSGALVVRPSFEGRHGHPILIAARGADEILQLPSDATLKEFVQRHRADTVEVRVDDPAILVDVDSPADYQRALEMFWRSRRSLRCTESEATAAAGH